MAGQCSNCNNSLRPGAKFCPRCGDTLAAQSSPPPAPYVPSSGEPAAEAAGHAAWRASKKGVNHDARI